MIRKYDAPLTLEPTWFEMIFGLFGYPGKTKEINEEMIRERKLQHYNIVTEQMSILCEELTKDLDKADHLKRKKLASLPSVLDSDRNTPESSDITKIILEFDIFVSSVNGKCEMIYETVSEIKKLMSPEELRMIGGNINSYEDFSKDVQIKLGKMKEDLTGILEKSLREEYEIMIEKSKYNEEIDASKKIFGDFEQKYVKSDSKPNVKSDTKPNVKSDTKRDSSSSNPVELFKMMVSGPPPLLKSEYIPEWSHDKRKLFQQIKKTYRKLAIKYHPDKNDDPESEEIFKRISSLYDLIEKDDEFSKFAGKSKKKKKNKKKKKQTKKAKKKS
jgi:hypothetical protein